MATSAWVTYSWRAGSPSRSMSGGSARGGALLDRDHGLDGHVPQRGVRIVQVRDEVGQGLAPRHAAQGLHDGTPQQLVAEELQQGGSRARVADLAQGVDGGVL